MDYSQLSERIVSAFPDLSPRLQIAARYVLDRPDEVALKSMRSLATDAGVHPTTMVRLARAFEFDSFNDFRRPFQNRFRRHIGDYLGRAQDLQTQAGQTVDVLHGVSTAANAHITETLQVNGIDRFKDSANALLASNRIFVSGLRSCYPIAFYFFYVLSLFRNDATLLADSGGVVIDKARVMGPGESLFVVSFEPYTRETAIVSQVAKDRGTTVVAMTDSRVSPLSRHADHTLLVNTESPSFFQSMAPPMAAAEALLAVMVSLGGDDALARIADSEKFLRETRAYLAAEDGAL